MSRLDACEMLDKAMQSISEHSDAESMESLRTTYRDGDLVVIVDHGESYTVVTCDQAGNVNRVWLCPEIIRDLF